MSGTFLGDRHLSVQSLVNLVAFQEYVRNSDIVREEVRVIKL